MANHEFVQIYSFPEDLSVEQEAEVDKWERFAEATGTPISWSRSDGKVNGYMETDPLHKDNILRVKDIISGGDE